MHSPPPDVADRLRRWQGITLGTLFVGYMGYYVCRSNLSIATPLLLADYKDEGLEKRHIGDIVAAGVLLYAVGKSINGLLTEYLGGRLMFLFGMFASAICTLLLAFLPFFSDSFAGAAKWFGLPLSILLPLYVLWCGNRFVQSMGWGGLVQITARWFEAKRMATVMGFLCMSYLLGDAIARAYLGEALKLEVIRDGVPMKLNWQGIFFLSSGTLFAIGVVSMVLLKGRPAALNLPEPPPPPGNVYGSDSGDRRIPLWQLLKPLFMSFTFWLVCLMNVGLTLIRESFNFWTPTYLNEAVKINPADSASASLVFPLGGAMAALFCGWLVDRSGGRYGPVVMVSLVFLALSLALMWYVPVEHQLTTALVLIGFVAFSIMGPYSFCSGVLAMRIGGQRAGATAAGIIDTMGYLGATLAGSGVSRIAESYGWPTVFLALAGVAGLTCVVAAIYTLRGEKYE